MATSLYRTDNQLGADGTCDGTTPEFAPFVLDRADGGRTVASTSDQSLYAAALCSLRL
jgi:hypothetical protein